MPVTKPGLPSPSIDPRTGEFIDPAFEQRFRAAVLQQTVRFLRLSLSVVGLLFLLNTAIDLGTLTNPDNLLPLFSLRAAVAAGCFVLVAALGPRPQLASDPWPVNLVVFLLVNASLLVVPLRPETLNVQLTSVLIICLSIYLFIPNRIPWMLVQNLWLLTGFMLALLTWSEQPLRHIGAIGLVVFAANVVGLLTALRLNRLQREQFAALEEAQRTNQLLQQEITERQRLEVGLRELAQTDALTGLNNRRSFLELAEQALRQARRTSAPLTLCMIDIDHFKDINDTRGHAAGDLVLAAVATVCRDQLRDSDIIGRYGGEEFVVALPNTDAYAGRIIAERLRARIEALRLQGDLATLRLTVTAGIAQVLRDEDSLDPALLRADEALYEGKREGRNQVALAT